MSDGNAKCQHVDGKLAVSNDYLSVDILLEEGVNPTKSVVQKDGQSLCGLPIPLQVPDVGAPGQAGAVLRW